jgi:hypothetical protein
MPASHGWRVPGSTPIANKAFGIGGGETGIAASSSAKTNIWHCARTRGAQFHGCKEELLNTLGDATAKLRERLGESLTSVSPMRARQRIAVPFLRNTNRRSLRYATPDCLSRLVELANFMRLFDKKQQQQGLKPDLV